MKMVVMKRIVRIKRVIVIKRSDCVIVLVVLKDNDCYQKSVAVGLCIENKLDKISRKFVKWGDHINLKVKNVPSIIFRSGRTYVSNL